MGHNWRRVLLALLALVAVAQCAPLLGDCALLELLPTDLTDSISFVQPDGQAHFQGEFFVDFQRENHHNITFDLKFDTTFRFYVAPHEIDIDLWLYPIGGRNSIAHSALDVAGAPEVIFGHLPPGGYRLTMFFFGDPSQLSACPAVVVEMEMIPDTILASRMASFHCPFQPVYPQIDFTDLNEGYPFSFATTDLPSEQADVLNVQSTASKLRSTVTWATAYNFTVPRVSGRPVLWQVEASLGYQFLSGGSLGLLLVPNSNSSAPPDPRCYLDGKGCWLGSNLRMNEHVISELVRPGDYQLWLFDQVGEKDPNITLPCTPFSLTLSIRPTTEEEDLLNCAAPRVPTTLNGPDGLDALGYYTLTADMLLEIDPSTLPTEHRISLRPAVDSLVRVEASESLFDVDVALYLADSDEPLAMSNRFAGYTDAVALDVAANTNYTIVLRFWGRYAPRFCETFPLAIAVAPVPSFDFCTAAVPSLPDLSALDAALAASEKLKREDYGPFVFDYAANYEARAVYRHNFTVVDVTNVKFVLGFNFLLGGLDIALRNRATDERLFGEQRGNVALLQGELHPGDYEVSVLLSPTQTLYRTNLTGVFPPCLRYTLGVAAVPSASAADDLCWQVLKTPTDLRELAYLGSAPYVHITDAFLVPDVGGKKSEDDDIAIKVAQASLLHVYTPARADLDIRLTLEDDAGKRVATSDNQYGEEEILVPLDAGERYTLTIRYYRPRQALPLCATYDLHLLVEPLPPGKPTPPAPGACSAAPLPADLFAGSGAPGWAVTRSASLLVAKDASAVVDVPLTLNQPTYLVAQLAFPFALTQISVSVLTDADATPIASSRPSVTGSALDVVLLPAGTFTLRLATLSAPAQGVAVCVPFTIVVASAPAASESLLSQPCTATSMPASLNAVPFFHPLGGYSLHFTRELLISDIIDETAFELTAESLVRVFTSGHPSVDVDVYLYSLTPHDPDSKVLAVSNGYGEELVVARLPRGSYTLVLRYAGGTDALILPDECIYFTLEMAAAPIADLLDNPDITQPCPAHAPAVTTLEANTSYSGLQWLVPLPSNVSLRFQQTFELRDVGYLAADLRYDFLIGGLSLTLARAGSPVHDAEINMNHAYLRTALPAGQYTLAVTSNTATLNTYGDLSFVRCSQFELDFLLNTTADPSFCDAVDVLPTDLFSANGGSQPYGGPQSPLDGSVQIYGDRFLAQRGVSEADVLFMAPRNVFARFFATAGAGSDLDFVLYSDAGKGQILAYSIGFEDFESSLFLLPAQPQPYLLAIKFWRLPRLTCPYYRFEAVIRDNATVADDLRCPAYLPPDDRQVPPSAVTLTAGSSLESSSSDYVLTKARLTQEARGSRWEHRISLNLPGNTTLVASVLFDFLTADFRLALSGPDTRLDGSPDYADDRASELNFENRLEADLPKAGVYTLVLRFQLVTSATQLADYCFNFAFSLSLASSAAPRPTVLAVDPPSGDNLQAAAGLTVRVAFSEQFAQVAATTDFTTVAALRTQGSGQLVRPSSAAPFNNRNGLRFVWSAAALADGAVYTLVLTPSLLSSTSAGVPFADYPFAHVYSFLSCDCNGHGTCTKDATGLLRCACTFPYAGEACQACADGYHGVGGRCEQDAQCTPALCGEHGRCDDSSGVPRCFCNDRYATLGDRYCSVCAPGYVNYPNCTARDEALEESTLCTAPLLPSTLDGLMAERDEVHLSGDFFLDADTKVHDVDFELRRDSVLRVYAEPHWIDVDLWLFPLHPDGSVGDDIAYSLRVYAEEELYIVLNGSAAAPPRYRLSFRYFIWNRKATPTDCETLNVELALKPLDTVQREVAAAARLCPAGADLLPMPLERRLPLLEVPTSGYSVHDSTVYALHAHDGVAPDAPDFFWNVTFSVAEVPNTEVLLTVQLDHQFLPGALALLLETGDARRHCGQFGASSARATCQPGRSAFNRNMLFTMLPPGTYTLWIYQPAPLLPAVAACAPFNFAFNISYVPTEDEDIFNCAAPRLPLSLNAPGMLSPRGFLHLAQEFLIEPDNAPVAFQLAAPSRIRVAASSALPIYFFLRSHDRANSSFVAFGLALHGSAQLAAALAPGAYSLHFWSWDSAINPADAAFCVPTLVQLALSPDGHQPATLCPPGVVASRLPDLTRTRVPTTLPPTRYYALRPARDTEASYNLRFESDTHVDVALTSDFVSAGVGVRLEYTASGRAMVVDGEYAFNQARLSGVFGRGNYTLRLLFPRSDTADVVCTPFDFSIELAPARAFVEPACDGEPLPLNLNELRYLGAAPVLDYFGVFRVPLVSDHSISFTNVTATGPGPSALHVFLDQPAAVMFQGALHRLDAAGARTPVAPLVSGLLRAQLEPNTTYQIELALARQLGDAGDATCVSVPIMWSVAPLALWPLPAECPQAARDHLPTIVPPPVGLFKQFQRWNYSSVALGEALYLQQAFDAPRSFSYTFDTDSLGRLYAAVGYDLRAGLLQVALTSASTGRMEGTLVRDQSVLVLENLAPGTYTLEVSEPRPERNVNRLTCLAFSLELIIERDASMLLEEVTANELPASLDTVAFLAYSPIVHFAVQALFTRPLLGVADPTIAFRLATRSAVRVLVQRSRDFAVRVLFDNAANPDEGAGAFLLGPGPHTLTLQRSLRWQVRDSADMWERDVQLGVEISIVPLAEADALYATGWVADVDSCAGRSVARVPSDVDPDAEGFYSFASTRLALSPAQQQRAATAPVHTVQFVLSEPSIVYAEVTYDPLYGDVAVRLVDSERILPPYFATVGQGRSVVHTVAPAEVYNLELYQPSPALGQPHCVPLSFRLVIHDAVDARGGLVCSDFNRLPFSLSTLDGGSLAYGGPMSQGAVSIYGDEFLYPPNSDSDSLRLDVAVTTLVSVYVAVERGAPLNTALYAPNATDPVAALFADAASSTHRQLYIIEPGRGHAKPFTLTIEFPWARPLIACPYYTFALVARPLSVVQSNLVCLRSVQPQAIPARVPLSYGFAEVQLTSSFAHRTDEVLPDLFVNFTLANASLLVTSLAFDSLVLSAELILQRADNPAQIWSRSVVRASAYRSQPFDMEVRLNVPLLEPAAYTLRIRRQVFPAVPFTAASLCLPFSWFFFVAPHQGAPYLLADPPGGVALRPETNLVLMLSFSAAPCNASGAPFNFATSHAFATLFSLVPQGGADVATLLPLWVQPSSESMTWRLVFNGLEANTTYVLRLADGALFDSLRREFRQPVSARYAVGQSGCSGHGALVVGECTCDEGYEGAYCEECADGFHEQGSDDQTVCVPDGEKCAVDSCGCQPAVAPCQPLGACDDSSGTVQCTCFSNRAGRRCDSCLPGYGPFPACPLIATSAPPCPCAHGSCAADGSCQCPPNWRGDLCDACAAGFEGDDCHASPATTATSSPATTATTSATTTATTSATTSATTTATSASSQPTTAPTSLTRITEIAAVVFVVIIAAGVAALCWVRRKQQAARRYADLPSESDTDVMLEERTVTVGNEKVAVKVNDDEDTFNPRSKNQDKMFEL